MRKHIYISLCIVSCCLFLISCREIKTKTYEEYVAQSWPYYRWHWNYNYPYQQYWYSYAGVPWGPVRIDDSWPFYEQQLELMEKSYEIRNELLQKKIEKLEVENEELRAELEDKGTWIDFWQTLKEMDEERFQTVLETLNFFVQNYREPASRITVQELQAILNLKGNDDEEIKQKIEKAETEKEQKESQDKKSKCCQEQKQNPEK